METNTNNQKRGSKRLRDEMMIDDTNTPPALNVLTGIYDNHFDLLSAGVKEKRKSNSLTQAALNNEFPGVEFRHTQLNFQCVVRNCTEIFHLTHDLYDHIRIFHKITEDDMRCEYCGYECKCMATLVYHTRTHTQEKPYVCPIGDCGFATATKGNLKSHLQALGHKDVMSVNLLNTILAMDTVKCSNVVCLFVCPLLFSLSFLWIAVSFVTLTKINTHTKKKRIAQDLNQD